MKKVLLASLICLIFASFFPDSATASEKGVVSEIYFSPIDGVAEKLIARIEKERETIRVAAYCLMHAGIAKALKGAHARGVDVEVILDPYSIKVRSPIAKMVEVGIPVFVWNPALAPHLAQKGKKKPLMHDKFCVFGNHSVWTGSFNFTREGTLANRENVVILQGTDVAKRYLEEFAKIKKEGCSPYQIYMDKVKNDPSGELNLKGGKL